MPPFAHNLFASRLSQTALAVVLTGTMCLALWLAVLKPAASAARGSVPSAAARGRLPTIRPEQAPMREIQAAGQIRESLHTRPEGMDRFSVMTLNVGAGAAPPKDLARVLKESGADIVGLQEVTRKQADALREMLAEAYPYQVFIRDGIPGKGLLSRYPISRTEELDLVPGRPDLLAELDVNGRPLQVIVAHPQPPRIHTNGLHWTAQTEAQFSRLAELASNGQVAILLGDFNMTDHNAHYAALVDAGLSDAYHEAGQGPGNTFPVRWGVLPLNPLVRIDYIWYSHPLQAVEASLGADAGSDHLPVLAVMAWP